MLDMEFPGGRRVGLCWILLLFYQDVSLILEMSLPRETRGLSRSQSHIESNKYNMWYKNPQQPHSSQSLKLHCYQRLRLRSFFKLLGGASLEETVVLVAGGAAL